MSVAGDCDPIGAGKRQKNLVRQTGRATKRFRCREVSREVHLTAGRGMIWLSLADRLVVGLQVLIEK